MAGADGPGPSRHFLEADTVDNCVFCRIAAGQIPSAVVHSDGEIVAFRDIDPMAPVHVLVIPRRHISSVNELDEEDAGLIGRMVLVARTIASLDGIAAPGYRLVLNTGPDGGQSVGHLHLHLLGGRGLGWPPG
jgi:histidine triad (HIT) family protein